MTPSPETLIVQFRAALDAENEPRAALATARLRYNAARRELAATQKAARAAERRLIAAIRAMEAAGIDPAVIFAPPDGLQPDGRGAFAAVPPRVRPTL
jgi:predicted deacetylase